MGLRKTAIATDKAPQAIGPYSQAIALGDLIFVSGQTPLKPDGTPVKGTVAEQTEQCLLNIRGVLAGCGMMMDRVVKTTVYMTDLGKFAEMNEVYGRHLPAPHPARATVQVVALPKGADVEIEAIAARP